MYYQSLLKSHTYKGHLVMGYGVIQVSYKFPPVFYKSPTSILQVLYMSWGRGHGVGVMEVGVMGQGSQGRGHGSFVGSQIGSDSFHLLHSFFCTKGLWTYVRFLQVSYKSPTSILQVSYMGHGIWIMGQGQQGRSHGSFVGSQVGSNSFHLLHSSFCTEGGHTYVRLLQVSWKYFTSLLHVSYKSHTNKGHGSWGMGCGVGVMEQGSQGRGHG